MNFLRIVHLLLRRVTILGGMDILSSLGSSASQKKQNFVFFRLSMWHFWQFIWYNSFTMLHCYSKYINLQVYIICSTIIEVFRPVKFIFSIFLSRVVAIVSSKYIY